jgi:uncharacterized protein YbjQ (UPF0145 family)
MATAAIARAIRRCADGIHEVTGEETEDYTENVRVALGQALFSLSADGRTLPVDDDVFVPR